MGGSTVSQPKQVSLGQTVNQISGTQGNTFSTEQQYQPQYQQLGQQLSAQSLYNFGQTMNNYISPYASNLTGQQFGYNQNLYNQYAPGAEQSILNANPYIQQGETASEGLYNQGLANQSTANNLLNSGQSIIGSGQNLINSGQGIVAGGENLVNSGQGIVGYGQDVVGQGQGLIGYGKNYVNAGWGQYGVGAGQEAQGVRDINSAMNMNNVISGDPMLRSLNGIVNQNLANFGGVTGQEMNAIDQGTGATFAANGLFNSNPASAAALLNRDQFAQNRLQAWTGIGQSVQGLNAQEQAALLSGAQGLANVGLGQEQAGTGVMNTGLGIMGSGISEMGTGANIMGTGVSEMGTGANIMGTGVQQQGVGANIMGTGVSQQQAGVAQQGVGVQQQGIGAQLANYAGLQEQMGIGGIQNTANMVQGGINQLVSPGQYNANIQSLASSFAPGQVTPQIIPQELGTASGLNEFNAQGQFAANAANAQMQNQQSAAMMGLGGAGIAALGSIFGGLAAAGAFCHIAREVYGINNIKWVIFRNWMITFAPVWFVTLYKKFGKGIAKFISDKPVLKNMIEKLMDKVIKEYAFV